MTVLADSSIWVEYLRGRQKIETIDWLIDEGLLATNDLILSELLPILIIQKQIELAALLREIPRLALKIDWQELIEYQVICLRNGINKVGIPDLIIAQNAIQHRASLLTLDKHFRLIAQYLPLAIQQV